MERKYRMTRIDGDYFFSDNDARTLCRVGSYTEDGSAGVTGKFWCSFVFNGTLDEAASLGDTDPDAFVARYDWFGARREPVWCEVSHFARTRAEAIDDALKFAAMREP